MKIVEVIKGSEAARMQLNDDLEYIVIDASVSPPVITEPTQTSRQREIDNLMGVDDAVPPDPPSGGILGVDDA